MEQIVGPVRRVARKLRKFMELLNDRVNCLLTVVLWTLPTSWKISPVSQLPPSTDQALCWSVPVLATQEASRTFREILQFPLNQDRKASPYSCRLSSAITSN